MIKLVILDQGGLLTRDFDIVPEAAARLGIGPELLRAALAPDMDAFMRGKLRPMEVWRRAGERCRRYAREDYFATLFRPSLDLPTRALIERLVAAGKRVVSGTNTIDSHFRILRELKHFEPYDAVYASHTMGLAKPDPAFWKSILDCEGFSANRVFFADDNEENVKAAQALGIESRLFVDAAGLAADLEALGILAPLEIPL